MKLNPTKFVFGVSSGKFLGFMVSQRGIEANPDKVRAIFGADIPKNNERNPESNKQGSSPELVCLTSH